MLSRYSQQRIYWLFSSQFQLVITPGLNHTVYDGQNICERGLRLHHVFFLERVMVALKRGPEYIYLGQLERCAYQHMNGCSNRWTKYLSFWNLLISTCSQFVHSKKSYTDSSINQRIHIMYWHSGKTTFISYKYPMFYHINFITMICSIIQHDIHVSIAIYQCYQYIKSHKNF